MQPMALNKSDERFNTQDLFIDYEYEVVMFRWDYKLKKAFRKFYGESDESPIDYENGLFNEALVRGQEVALTVYTTGKSRR